jgi:hypothetical protein
VRKNIGIVHENDRTPPHSTAHVKLNIFLTALELDLLYMCTKAALYIQTYRREFIMA